jgi:pimeloyl-ACP methyl ester carboxylesterase
VILKLSGSKPSFSTSGWVYTVGCLLAFAPISPLAAQTQNRYFVTTETTAPSSTSKKSTNSLSPLAVAGCPNQGGQVNSISVPVSFPIRLRIGLFQPAPLGGVFFQLSSDDPSVAQVGDASQGFRQQVFVPPGQFFSDPVTVLGVGVGRTQFRAVPSDPSFPVQLTPLGAWNVNPLEETAFLDANPSDQSLSCRVGASPDLSNDPQTLARCGSTAFNAVSDGVTQLLLRTASGLPGKVCYEIVSQSPLDQGSIQTPLSNTINVAGTEYGFSYYKVPAFYGDNSDFRTVEVEFTFTPSIGNGNTTRIRAGAVIRRPPVVLIHGIWDSPVGWDKTFVRNDPPFRITRVLDYEATNAESFSVNVDNVGTFIARVVRDLRNSGTAVTQVDVLGHSMGALLTRIYVGTPQYKRSDNLGLGDIHRLISLNTPHFGSSFANLVIALHRVQPQLTERVVTDLTEGIIVRGAVCDLAENSPALAAIPASSPIPTLAITGTAAPPGTPDAPALYWQGFLGIFNSFEAKLRFPAFPRDIVDNFRFRQPNDAVVGLSSQQGGLRSTINFPDALHFGRVIPGIGSPIPGITFNSQAADQAFQSLDGPDSGFNPNTPAVISTGTGEALTVPGRGVTLDKQDYAAECSPGGPLKPAVQAAAPQAIGSRRQPTSPTVLARNTLVDQRLHITSPVEGQLFTPGQTITIVVQVDPSLSATRYLVSAPGIPYTDTDNFNGSSYTVEYPLPPGATGPITLTPYVLDAANQVTSGPDVRIGVKPSTPPVALTIIQDRFSISGPSARVEHVSVRGTFADGSELVLTSSVTGTTYQSSNPSVVQIDREGAWKAVGSGTVVVTVQNGGVRAFATIVVGSSTGMVTEDITPKVTISRSGFRLDRQTGFFVQDVTVTNPQSLPIVAPLYLVLSGLPSGVTPVNLRGRSRSYIPGSPYMRLQPTGTGEFLAPGQRLSLQLQFLNPGRVPITYIPKVIFRESTP